MYTLPNCLFVLASWSIRLTTSLVEGAKPISESCSLSLLSNTYVWSKLKGILYNQVYSDGWYTGSSPHRAETVDIPAADHTGRRLLIYRQLPTQGGECWYTGSCPHRAENDDIKAAAHRKKTVDIPVAAHTGRKTLIYRQLPIGRRLLIYRQLPAQGGCCW